MKLIVQLFNTDLKKNLQCISTKIYFYILYKVSENC